MPDYPDLNPCPDSFFISIGEVFMETTHENLFDALKVR